MSIDFATLKGLAIPEGNVTQITDASGRVLWKQAPSEATITITKVGSLPPNTIGAQVIVNGTNYSDAITVTVPIGTIITCTAKWTTKYMASTHTGGTVMVNGAVVAESGELSGGTTTYEYTVQGDVAIELSVQYVQTSQYGGMTPTGNINITES